MDLSWYLRLVRSRWILVAVPVVVGVLIGVATWSISKTDSASSHYRAVHTLIFQPPSDSSSWAYQSIDEISLLATGGDVTKRVGDKLGEGDPAQRIVTRADDSARTLQLIVVGRQARRTARLADAVAAELRASVDAKERARFVVERDATIERLQNLAEQLTQIDDQIAAASGSERDVLTAQRRGIFNQYTFTYEQFQQFTSLGNPTDRLSSFEDARALRISAGDYDAFVDLVSRGENHIRVDPDREPVELPSGSSLPDGVLLRALLGAFLGLLLGLALAFTADRVKPRLRTRGDVERAFGAPVIAEIPRLRPEEQRANDVVAVTTPRSRAAEAYRAARSRIGRRAATAAPERDGLVVLVTSPSQGEGKTTTTANLAAVFAETGASVLAVSCDQHRPRLDRLLRPSSTGDGDAETSIPGVRFAVPVAVGSALLPPKAAALQRQAIDAARHRYDVVLVDVAPLVVTNDAVELMPVVDTVVLVARAEMTTLAGAERAHELLEQLGASVAGVVLLDPYLSPKDSYYDASDASSADTAHVERDPGGEPAQPVNVA